MPVTQPSIFIAGADDTSLTWLADAVAAHPETLPGLLGSHVLPDCGHWVQQERADLVTDLLIDWLTSVAR